MIFDRPVHALSDSELEIAANSFDLQERSAAYAESWRRFDAEVTRTTTATPERDTP